MCRKIRCDEKILKILRTKQGLTSAQQTAVHVHTPCPHEPFFLQQVHTNVDKAKMTVAVHYPRQPNPPETVCPSQQFKYPPPNLPCRIAVTALKSEPLHTHRLVSDFPKFRPQALQDPGTTRSAAAASSSRPLDWGRVCDRKFVIRLAVFLVSVLISMRPMFCPIDRSS